MSKSVWYISKYVVPTYAGKVGSRGYLILRAMASKGHKCVLICSDSNHLASPPSFETPVMQETVEGVFVNWIKTRKYKGANSLGRILSWISFEWGLFKMRKNGMPAPDVIIVSSLSLLTIVNGLWLRRRYRCKLIFEIRDIWPLSLQELRGWSSWNPLVLGLGLFEKLGYRAADLVVGTMPNLREHVVEVLGYSKEIACIPQGIDENNLKSQEELSPDFVNSYLPKGKFIVVYAGTIGVANALRPFFEAARRMQENDLIHFLVLGDGYLKEKYQTEFGGQSNITFAPSVPKAKVLSVLSRCDLMFFSAPPSRLLRFGQSLNKLIDYMASGRPILASYTGFPSMINEAECGIFVPAGDVEAICGGISHYLAMPATERYKVGQAGRDWLIANRSFSALADKYLELIEKTPNRWVKL